ncbi:PQQ-binding-like beta-propeller repeat protein [Actinoplanes sp. CA-030573]|uniref:outer membrane protein assembly factor BamB family protein n=1 Tax=Actinoplanes sp. CA-030573 TaxID=3239898 RepID=UPI003D8C1274
MASGVIDLDRAPPRPRPRPGHGGVHRARPIVAVLLALMLGGSVAPAGHDRITHVADTGGRPTAFALAPGALFAAHGRAGGGAPGALFAADGRAGGGAPGVLFAAHGRVGGGATVIEAIPLGGGPGWSAALAGERPALSLDPTGSTLVYWPAQNGRITFLDAATGRVRWEGPESGIARVIGDRVAVADPMRSIVRMADLATGRTIWEARGEAYSFDIGDPGTALLSLDHDGRATLRSVADGSVLASGRDFGIDPYEQGIGRASAAVIAGGTVYVHAQTFVAAYRLRDLVPLWRTPVLEPSEIVACGPLVCATGSHGATALDPATGAVRWTNPVWQTISNGLAMDGGGGTVRFDPATGRVVAELGRGGVVGGLMLRFDGERTWVSDLAGGRVIGFLPMLAPGPCTAAGIYLACLAGDAVSVWAIR